MHKIRKLPVECLPIRAPGCIRVFRGLHYHQENKPNAMWVKACTHSYSAGMPGLVDSISTVPGARVWLGRAGKPGNTSTGVPNGDTRACKAGARGGRGCRPCKWQHDLRGWNG